MAEQPRLGIIGFGEVGYHTAKGLRESGLQTIWAYNSGHRYRPPYPPEYRRRAEEIGVTLVDTLGELAQRAQFILSVTSPASAVSGAQEAAHVLDRSHIYVDMNSSGPRPKQEAAAVIEVSGARFVDACLLSGATVDLHRGLTYLSGEAAAEYQRAFKPFGMELEVIPDGKPGDAALVKMLRSILTKGTMSVLWELSYAAYKCGVDLRQYQRALGPFRGDFFAAADRTIGYGYVHARRRAEESHDIQETLRDHGVEPYLAEAYEKRLRWAARWEDELRQRFAERTAPPTALEVLQAIEELEHAVAPTSAP